MKPEHVSGTSSCLLYRCVWSLFLPETSTKSGWVYFVSAMVLYLEKTVELSVELLPTLFA